MKCPNCGETLKKGFLYCEKCGEEIRIVPDFEPEIENSIIETLSAVAEEMAPASEDNLESDSETETEFEIEPNKNMKHRVLVSISLFCLLVLGVFAIFFIRNIYLEKYYTVQVENAQLFYNQKNYEEAIQYYENALEMEENTSLLISYADCLYEVGKTDQALSHYYAIIDAEPENQKAYARIIAIYEKEENYSEINALLSSCGQQSIKTEFQSYMTSEPVFSYESGDYNHVIPLKIQAPTTGTTYYSLDGSDPRFGGIEYTSPLFLRYGEYQIKAVFINDFGLASNVVEANYTIEGTQPQQPQVFPESGQFNLPQMISIEVPEGCTVYYSMDGSVPDENSYIYGEPMPMKEGTTNYRFITLSADGVYSEVTARSYQLVVETNYTAVESVYRLVHRLVEREFILDVEGNLANMSGKNIYVYNSIQIVEDKIFHIIYEYYQEGNNSRNMTGKIYGIDVSNGYVYRIIKDENGVVTLDPI